MAIFTAIAAIATAVGGFLSSTFLAGGIGAFLLRTAVGIGLNFLASAIAGKPEEPKFSITGKLQAGDDQPRGFPMGKTATAGTLVYANTSGDAGGTPNAYLTQVIALSDMPVDALTGFWVNGEKVTLPDFSQPADSLAGWAIPEYDDGSGSGKHSLWIRFYDGTQTAADSFLVNNVSSGDRPYASTRVGTGIAYAIVTAQVVEELFTGFPSFKFELSGIKLYDPSKDTSVGGNGTQRYDTPSTWASSENPAVQVYNLLRGISYGGKWLYGVQNMPAARLPVEHWIAQIQKCNAQIAGPDGNENIYRSGGFVTVDAPVADAVNAIQTACSGRLAEIGGTYKFPLGVPSTAADWSFSDGDILSTEDQSFTPFFGLADTINGVTAKYPSPEDAWNTKVAPPLYNADYETEDGDRRLLSDVTLNFVPYAAQVQRLMKSALAEARRARRHTFVLPPDYWGVEPGDIMSWTSERNGYETKLFRVDGVADKANLDVTVDITEVDPADYDWDQETDYRAPVSGTINQARPPAQDLTGWQVAPAEFYDSSALARRPSIQVSYTGGQVDVDGVRVQVRLAASGAVVFDGTLAYDAPLDQQYSVILNGVFLPNTDYEARGIYTSISARAFTWSAWLAVTTPDVRIGAADLYPISLGQFAADVKSDQEFVGQGLRDLIEQVSSVVTLTIDQDTGQYRDKQILERSVRSTYRRVTAEYSEAIAVATGPGSAIVGRIEDLEVEVNDNLASAVDTLTAEINTVDGKTTANADAITALSTTVGNFTASGKFRVETVATETGATATIGLSAAASDSDETQTASLFLSATTAGTSRVTVVADQFIITDGVNDKAPFVFTDGEATMNVANIGTVNTGLLQSPSGDMVIDLTNGNITISD